MIVAMLKADNSNESAPSLKAIPKYFEIGEKMHQIMFKFRWVNLF